MLLYEVIKLSDGTWRIGNSFEEEDKVKARDLIKKGKAKVLDLPIYEVPKELEKKQKKKED